MASGPLKRLSPYGDDELPTAKRTRTDSTLTIVAAPDPKPTGAQPVAELTSMEEQARSGLRRSIALILQHVGFDSTSGPALERLTEMTEEYMLMFSGEVMLFASAARRSQPIPTDYDIGLKRVNLGTGLLKPHLKPPIPKPRITPTYATPAGLVDTHQKGLPLLGEELSGRPEKEAKIYIPKSFPDFPSIHTYKATPQDTDEVTVQGTGLRWSDDGTPVVGVEHDLAAAAAAAEEAAMPGAARDPRRVREASARESKQAEEALRRVVRASKINTLKEARLAAQRGNHSRRRYDFWEEAMREMVEEGAGVKANGKGGSLGLSLGAGASKSLGTSSSARSEIADHSMIVNAQRSHHRQEVSRSGKRAHGDATAGK
ncbi:hypothetical protein GGTG_09744 [Gaeumannomyces tritici R3-111a-1]|uniref:Transcription initiation factor TFIID subunit 8 n=1 Tax=Gaeumannomyces tritici (strain R3-111a-1) TaxID=644352 RepID=J3P8B0_GAET3|nr:hypothetical protein GGTG_09744 [Gaeumannomyces tritici R3-111a-1]EJT72893.1 hypothetical protein GGTG_09744 [Gaeumannomyces tritici R3-111a-1]